MAVYTASICVAITTIQCLFSDGPDLCDTDTLQCQSGKECALVCKAPRSCFGLTVQGNSASNVYLYDYNFYANRNASKVMANMNVNANNGEKVFVSIRSYV